MFYVIINLMSLEQFPGFEVPAGQLLPGLSQGSLKDLLIGIHNEMVPEETLLDFDADKNAMGQGMGGVMDSYAVRYPRRQDKEELLTYALEEAKACQDPRDGALLLAASVVAIHPFNEGNGRVSRALYSDLLGTERPDTPGEKRRLDIGKGRQFIDLGTAFTQDEWLSRWSAHLPYIASNLASADVRVVIHKTDVKDNVEATTLDEEAMVGLSDEEKTDLVAAIGADKFGNTYAKDGEGLSFATALVVSKHPELAVLIDSKEGRTWQLVNIHHFLPRLSNEQRIEFVSALWEHRKLRAQSTIDFLSDDTGSSVIMAGGRTTLRSLVIERTINLHSSRIPRR